LLCDFRNGLSTKRCTGGYDPDCAIANRDWFVLPVERAPGASQESAVLTTLAPGNYTAIVRGIGATSGVASVEVYDQDSGPGSLLANLSTRSGVGTGNNVMIGGIILTGQKTIIVRALGPTLTQFGWQTR